MGGNLDLQAAVLLVGGNLDLQAVVPGPVGTRLADSSLAEVGRTY